MGRKTRYVTQAAQFKPFPLGEGDAEWRRMRGSHSSEWRFFSKKRGCCDGRRGVLPLIRRMHAGFPQRGSLKGCLLLLALVFPLASCTQAAPRAPQIPADFTATVEVARGDFTYTADYTRRGGSETLHFTAPDSLAGLSAARTDGGCTLSVGGVTAAVPDDGIFMPFALFDAPDGCLTGSRDAGGLAVYTGRCGGNVYRIAVDGAGVPVQLSGSVGGVSAEVRVLKFTQNTPPAGEKGNAHE